MIATDAGCARTLLGNLIRYLRAALTHARSESATLHTEVELLKAYLAIMALRLPNRLTTEFDCDPDCLRLKFPAMLLQPLVENAITHGIEPAGDGGCIRVSVRCQGDKLMVSVDDTGVGLGNAHTAGTGAGIRMFARGCSRCSAARRAWFWNRARRAARMQPSRCRLICCPDRLHEHAV